MNLSGATAWLTSFDHPEITLETSRCIHSIDRFADCQACYTICPVEAIRAGNPPALDRQKCQGCTACLPVCPEGAFQGNNLVESLLKAAKPVQADEIDLFCSNHSQRNLGPSPDGVGFGIHGCLAGLGAGSYAAILALGFSRVLVRLDACPECRWNPLKEQILEQIEATKRLLALWGLEDCLIALSTLENPVERPLWDWDASQPGISRRDFFRSILPAPHDAGRPANYEARTIENASKLSHERLWFLQATSKWNPPVTSLDQPLEDFGFASLAISDLCTACRACARICPTGALRFAADPEETIFQLNFLSEACTGCEACLHVCLPKAIQVKHTPPAHVIFTGGQAVTLRQRNLAQCTHCGAAFATREGKTMCPACEYRANHPFGSISPITGRPFSPARNENQK